MDKINAPDTSSEHLSPDILGAEARLALVQKTEHKATGNWAIDNIAAPIVNTVLVQPYNGVASLIDAASQRLAGSELLPKATAMAVPDAKAFSPEWLVQNAATGLTMAAMFTGIGKGTGALSRSIGLPLSARASFIIGGAGFEGLREPGAGETRLGNALGTAAGFSVFEGGNLLSRNLSGADLWAARAATGALGATTQRGLSGLITNGELPTGKQLGDAALTGAFMNTALPAAQRLWGVSGAPIAESQRVGRSVESGGLPGNPQPMLKIGDGGNELQAATGDTVGSASSIDSKALIPEGFTASRVEKMPFVQGVPGTYASEGDFLINGQGRIAKPMQILTPAANGMPEVVVPVDNPPALSPGQALDYLGQTPDPSLVNRLFLLNHPHPMDPWVNMQYEGQRVQGEAFANGDLQLFKPSPGNEALGTTMHEWSHLFKMNSPEASAAFDAAAPLERLNTGSSSQNYTQGENWPILSEGLLGQNPIEIAATAQNNPIRSAIWGKALAERLAAVPEAQRGAHYERYQGLVDYIDSNVKPTALGRLQSVANDSANPLSQTAESVLRYLQ